MLEPTESEDLSELNRVIEAMIASRGEIAPAGQGV
jgi:glycine cleavage system protein P-like pyridoxal-binding family